MSISRVTAVNDLSTHPLMTHLVSRLRDIRLTPLAFRDTLGEIGRLLVYEALSQRTLIRRDIPTWKESMPVETLDESQMVIVPILRAALPMVEGVMRLFPQATGGFMAMKRDEESFQSRLYYDRLPDLSGKQVILCDPMLATGGSLCDALDLLKQKGATDITSLHIIAAPEGVKAAMQRHPDVKLFIAKIDQKLENGYIMPGIGDAGDRAYNTLQ